MSPDARASRICLGILMAALAAWANEPALAQTCPGPQPGVEPNNHDGAGDAARSYRSGVFYSSECPLPVELQSFEVR